MRDFMIKAVLFDMDGVLIDSETHHIKAMQQILKEELDLEVDAEEIGQFSGLTYIEKLKKIGIKNNIEKLSKKTNNRYIQIIRKQIKLSPGTRDLLEIISKTNLKSALVTASNKEQTNLILEKTRSKKYFDIVITGNDVKNRKPDPECYMLAAKKLDLRPKECVVIEDSIVGLTAAKEAGMKCIARPTPYIKRGDFSKADMIINSLEEINLDMIKTFN